MSEGKAVRITDKAHGLLAEKAEGSKVSMKEIASDAILTLFKGKDINKKLCLLLDIANKKILDNKRFALGAFAIGAIVSGCVMFFVGVLW